MSGKITLDDYDPRHQDAEMSERSRLLDERQTGECEKSLGKDEDSAEAKYPFREENKAHYSKSELRK